MRHRPFPFLVALACAIGGARLVSSQECVSYQTDPRVEADAGDPLLTQADMLITNVTLLEPRPAEHTYRLKVDPWTVFYPTFLSACPNRDYNGQATPHAGGSGVLVGQDLVLSVRHLFVTGGEIGACQTYAKFVFGYGNFSPNQWPITCDESINPYCWVTIPEDNVYSCDNVVLGPPDEDWAVVRLDRNVAGGSPLSIRRGTTPPDNGIPVTIVGHPNHIPMKVERHTLFQAANGEYFAYDAHILHNSSGSMAVDEATREVIGIVSTGTIAIGQDCQYNDCFREDFSNHSVWAQMTPAYLAAANIP
jgi:hypothetical protein